MNDKLKITGGEILVNHIHKLIYLPIFKNATIEMSSILLFYYNFSKIEFTKTNEIYDVRNIYINKILSQYPDYIIFICCRNPYLRYNSAIKFLKRQSNNNKNIEPNLDKIFINNELNEKLTSFSKNHLDKQYYFYDKCNYILRLENLNEEFIQLLIKLNIPINHYNYLQKNKKLNNSNKEDNIIFNDELINIINNFYNKDFEVFNYKMVKNVKELEEYKNNLIIENIDEIYNKYKNFFITKDELEEFLVNVIKEKENINNSFEDSFEDLFEESIEDEE